MAAKSPSIDLGALQASFTRAKTDFERTQKELLRAEAAADKAKAKYAEVRQALSSATRAILQ